MFQRVTIIGNLGGDPEMRYTPSGTAVTNFSVATTRTISKATAAECPSGWKESYNKKGWEKVTWFRVTVWRGQAEACNQYLEKGSQVLVEGEMSGDTVDGTVRPRIWEGNDGKPRCNFELSATNVKFLSRSSNGNGSGSQAARSEEPPPEGVAEEDIPF